MDARRDPDFRLQAEWVEEATCKCVTPFTPQYGQTAQIIQFQPDCNYAFRLQFDDGFEAWFAYHEVLMPSFGGQGDGQSAQTDHARA